MTKLLKPRQKREIAKIRVVGPDGAERIVAPGQLAAENELRRQREAREMRRQQELFALECGDVVAVRRTSTTLADPSLRWFAETGLWWFTARVNGPERTVTARTIVVERKCEEDFAFDVIRKYAPASPGETQEADRYRSKLGMPAPKRSTPTFRDDAKVINASRLSRAERELLARPEPSCIGYMNGCMCARCKGMDRLAA
jgi:hypothetical protein